MNIPQRELENRVKGRENGGKQLIFFRKTLEKTETLMEKRADLLRRESGSGMLYSSERKRKGIPFKTKKEVFPVKKFFALILALALAAAVGVPALADENFNAAGEYPLFKEKVSLTIGIAQNANVEDYETNWQTLYLEEQANVDLSFVSYAAGEMRTQLNMAINGGSELPDIIFCNSGLDLLYQWALAGAVIPLNEYLEKDAYYINDAVARTGVKFLDYVTSPDGNVYTLPQVNQSLTNEAADKIWIYQPWLDKLGLKAPSDAEELYNVLKAFKEQDPNGNGEADEIPLMSCTNEYPMNWYRAIMNMFQYTHNGNNYLVDNGKVIYNCTTDAWREGMQYIRRLFDEGLIDPMSFTADKAQLRALANGETCMVGMTVGMVSMGTANTQRIAEYVGIEPFKNKEGVRVTAFAPSLPLVCAMITSSCKAPEAAFRFLDLMYRKDISIINHWGEEGKHWAWAAAEDHSPYENMGYAASFREIEPLWGTVQNVMWYQEGPWAREYGVASGRVLPDNPLTTGARVAEIQWAYSPAYPDAGQYVPTLIFTEEETEAVSMILADVDTYVSAAIANFSLNKDGMDINDDTSWKAFLDQLETIGLSRAMEVVQTVYDRMYGAK